MQKGIDMSTNSNRMGASTGELGEALRANWLPLSMIGIGLAWLALGKGSLIERVAKKERAQATNGKIGEITGEPVIFEKPGISERKEADWLIGSNGEPLRPAGDRSGEGGWVHQAAGAARGAFGSVRDASTAVIGRASHFTGYASDAGDIAKRAGGQLAEMLKRDPWLIGVIGLIVGGLVAALLPPTRIEQEYFARARDELWTKANQFGHEAADRVRDLADPASRAALT
jgi:hypothetical protein